MPNPKLRYMTSCSKSTLSGYQVAFGLDHLSTAIQAFLTDRQASGLSVYTIRFYHDNLRNFERFCESQAITRTEQITADVVRAFLLWLERQGHNPGGRHVHFRTLRAFLFWLEGELDGYVAPIRNVKAPRVPQTVIEGVSLEEVQRMVAACKGRNFTELRDKAMLLFLLDTGVRVGEFVAVGIEDVDFATCAVLIRRGKGGKMRTVFFSRSTRRALMAYLRARTDDSPTLWVNRTGEEITRSGVNHLLLLRAKQSGLEKAPSAHDFRRAFALNMLRNGCDVFTLQRLMGHSDLTVLRRYLAQTDTDLQQAHRRASPVDRWRL